MNTIPIKQKLVHFDLKGAPPKLSYLKKIVEQISQWGATGVLIEYEDMFPYTNSVSHIPCQNAYPKQDIEDFCKYAAQYNIDVIPLVQSLGHLEFCLKHDKSRHMREMELYPNVLCPSHPDAFGFVTTLIEQMVEAHPSSSIIHIGGDEVWHLGKCNRCVEVMTKESKTNAEIYLNWISKISKWIKDKWPNLRIIIWDDMMRTIPLQILKEYKLKELIEPMVWKYESTDFNLPAGMFEIYKEAFSKIWTASAFKGSTGSSQCIPPIQIHINNHLVWLGVIDYLKQINLEVEGIALTGWQRYDHYAVLCELLPVGVPCLAFCLQVLADGCFTEQIHADLSKRLGFQELINVTPFPRPQNIEEGSFPGYQLYDALLKFADILRKYHAISNSESSVGWFNEFMRMRNYTNPIQVESILYPMLEIQKSLSVLDLLISTAMEEIFFKDTIEEWFGCFFNPLVKKVDETITQCNEQMKVGGRAWKVDKDILKAKSLNDEFPVKIAKLDENC